MKNHNKGHGGTPKRSRARRKNDSSEVAAAHDSGGVTDTPQSIAESDSSTPQLESHSAQASEGETLPSVAALATAADSAEPAASETPISHVAAPLAVPAGPSRARAEQIVQEYVPLAVGAGLIPLPGVDLAAIGGLQLKVLASLAQHYGVPFTRKQAQLSVTSLIGSMGTTVLAGAAVVSLAKVVPFVGTLFGAASVPVAGGVVTHALGHLAIDHFEAGGTMETFDLDVAQRAFVGKIAEAKLALA